MSRGDSFSERFRPELPTPVARRLPGAGCSSLVRGSRTCSAAASSRRTARLELLDRLAERVPELDLDRERVEWTTLDDGHEALIVNGGGFDGGDGAFLVNHGDDVHAVGLSDPIVPGHVGCIVIRPDGSRHLARAVPDPLAHQPKPD